MTVRFLSLARQELDDAHDWYEQQCAGLGREFLDEVDRVVRRIRRYPESCAELALGLRRGLLARFPYGLIYGRDGEALVIVAVAHLHRRPQYWVDRLKTS